MKFIEVTNENDRAVSISIDKITSVTNIEDINSVYKCMIATLSGATKTKTPYADILTRIKDVQS